jgi:glycosyltransferase A (GT-A) superfamily protein (DUF2064 family)
VSTRCHALLVLAKAPVAGLAKTRLCPPATPEQAAMIAAAALLDTLDAVVAVSDAVPMVAWTGRLTDAVRAAELADALAGTVQFSQCGSSLGERIAAAHAEVADRLPGAAVLQIGMDTPQLDADALAEALGVLTAPGGPDAVLGPAVDGGWWALGLRDPRWAAVIESVPTSRADTGERTLAALRAAGLRVALLPELSDVDTAADAVALVRGGRRVPVGARFAAEVSAVFGGIDAVGAVSRR